MSDHPDGPTTRHDQREDLEGGSDGSPDTETDAGTGTLGDLRGPVGHRWVDRVPRPARTTLARPMVRAVLAGLALAGSLPPWGWWPLAFVGIGLLDGLLDGAGARARFGRGTVVGLALFTPTMVWISQLTVPGYVIAVGAYAAILGGFCLLVPPHGGRRLALIGAWVLCESLRSAWPFGGVPLSLLAVGQVGGPLVTIARIGGVLALGGATVALGVALRAAVRGDSKHRDRPVALVSAASVAVLVLVAALSPSGADTGRTVDVAYVQGGGAQGTRAISSDSRKVFERHHRASQEVPPGLDLVLWPEDVVDTRRDVQDAPEGRELEDLARQLDATLVVGTVEGVSATEWRNSSQVLHADGTWGDRFVKVQRVPFGEWVPMRSFVERFAPDTLASRDASVSTQDGRLDTPAGPLATMISWEVFFGHRARSGVAAGGEMLYNPTNGSTYTGTFVQTQQIASSRLRAIETGRWLVQVSPTGFSAFISPTGEVFQRSGQVEDRVEVRRDVPLRDGLTWYVRFGDLPARVVAAAMVLAGWALDRRWRRRPLDLGPVRARWNPDHDVPA